MYTWPAPRAVVRGWNEIACENDLNTTVVYIVVVL